MKSELEMKKKIGRKSKATFKSKKLQIIFFPTTACLKRIVNQIKL